VQFFRSLINIWKDIMPLWKTRPGSVLAPKIEHLKLMNKYCFKKKILAHKRAQKKKQGWISPPIWPSVFQSILNTDGAPHKVPGQACVTFTGLWVSNTDCLVHYLLLTGLLTNYTPLKALNLAFVQVLTAERTVWLAQRALWASADPPVAHSDVHYQHGRSILLQLLLLD